MRLKIAGFEQKPQQQFQQEMADYAQSMGQGAIPSMASPIFADEQGNHFLGMPTEDGLSALPFIPGSPTQDGLGGFTPVDDLAAPVGDGGLGAMMAGAAGCLPPGETASWLGKAASNAMLAGAPGTAMAGVMNSLGLPNAMARGALGGAVAAAANVAGLGPVGGLLSGALQGGPAGMMGALGNQAAGQLMNATGLGNIPGGGIAASMLGNQLRGGLGDLLSDGLPGGMDNASGMINNIVPGGCTNPSGTPASAFDPASLAPQALDAAADELLSQWEVDDESSAAEQVAHKAVIDNKDRIKEAVSDPNGFIAKIKKFFSGESSSAILPIARLRDPDNKVDRISQGVASVRAECEPVARMSDTLSPSGMSIIEGAATVLTAGKATARVTSDTAVPSKILDGAASVLVGGGSTAPTAAAALPPAIKGNGGPSGPTAPSTGGSGSGGGGQVGNGGQSSADQGDSTEASDAQGSGSSSSAPDTTNVADGSSTSGNGQSASDPLAPGNAGSAPSTPLDQDDSSGNTPGRNDTSIASVDGAMCTPPDPEPWRENLREQLEDKSAQISWRDPQAKVFEDGKVDANEHRNRNEFDWCPPGKPTGTQYGIDWTEKSGAKNMYHTPLECVTGQPTDGSLGTGSFECCYYPGSGEKMDNVLKAGSYNYYHPSGISGNAGHFQHDMYPDFWDKNYSHVNMSMLPPPSPPPPPSPRPTPPANSANPTATTTGPIPQPAPAPTPSSSR